MMQKYEFVFDNIKNFDLFKNAVEFTNGKYLIGNSYYDFKQNNKIECVLYCEESKLSDVINYMAVLIPSIFDNE